jgi:UDP:flavonoid glycosyltransferase YjiC (YdhE family)
MRILFTCRPAHGHFHPLVPLARAAERAGHEVAFATGEPFRGLVEAAGFEAYSAGLSHDQWEAQMAGRFGDFRQQVPRTDHRRFFFGQVFADLELPARLTDLLAVAGKWRPDVLVHELADLAAPLAAELTGTPYATCGYGPLPEPEIAGLAAEVAGRHWAAAGLSPSGARLYRSLYLDPCPPSLQVPGIGRVTRSLRIRPEPAGADDCSPASAWLGRLAAGPTALLTMGTIWNRDRAVFTRVLDGLAVRPPNVIVTLGPGADPGVLGPQRASVHVCGYIPYAQLLGRCDLVICHGGAGSILGALCRGLPLLIIPQAADQFYNADQAVRAGAARRLLAQDLTPEAVADEVRLLLDDPGYRAAAAAIAAEIAAMPPASAAVRALECLAA